ncbi:MAG: hypothetical protein K8R60_13425 [Burkholderiales bacterium]|nr:hypothetical protein [Burkholderiales bacterium]
MNWVTTVPFVYPALEAVHIVGIGLLLGSLVVFEMRVWGLGRAVDLGALARLALPITGAGFALAAASGLVMFVSQFEEMIANKAFVWKMALIAVAGLNALDFHSRGGSSRDDRRARLQTALSLGLWLAIVACGRWIAYK